ncbi:hypothetical protein INS49_004231 [Diaporthe citri]|uniref:uncharacterized protein n=1 Tax=Diaporthe citri TaxID=83186 RepID=UPI001C7E5726|nr:uncharacterized protein INS49_004231 [Diaporthe citri]KAG6355150.1 hypothetical protein INS49_004231 [Diaporthe citri]
MMPSMWTIPLLHCIGCCQTVCSGACLASHRDRYCCHNPSCIFHAPCPAPPEPREPRTTRPAITSSTTEQAPTPSTDDAAQAEETPAATSGDPNVICRETITREWRLVGGDGTPAAGQTAAAAPTSTPPATFTIEEFEAQARLLAQFQRPQVPQAQRGRANASARGSGGVHGARRPRVRIEFD